MKVMTKIFPRWRFMATMACLLPCLTHLPAAAQPVAPEDAIFLTGFEGETIEPPFPVSDGEFVLPPGPAVDQLQWLLSELAVDETTTLAETQARFAPTFDPASIRDFINDVLRPQFPDARVVDPITVTPVRVIMVIDGDGESTAFGFLQLGARYTGDELITLLSVSDFSGSVQFPDDTELTLSEAADEYMALNTDNALFIGYIDGDGACQPLMTRDPDTPRALGSIFKTWVLGAVASDAEGGILDAADPVELVAAERAAGGVINSEPLGTVFPVLDMAVLMMGISDNTATDHLHELVGRELAGMMVQLYGVADPDLLLPFLNISEQFHVFTRFDLSTALGFVNGTEAFQQQFLVDEILPEGPSFPVSFPFFHDELLIDGTWRATATDICRTLAGLRSTPVTNGAFDLVDQAMSAGVAQAGVRNAWDRAWYKGGSLVSGSTGTHVLTHAWLLENSGDFPPYVVVALANQPGGDIDGFQVQSLTSRILQLVRGFEP